MSVVDFHVQQQAGTAPAVSDAASLEAACFDQVDGLDVPGARQTERGHGPFPLLEIFRVQRIVRQFFAELGLSNATS